MSEAGERTPPAPPELSREKLDVLIRRLQERKARRGQPEAHPDGEAAAAAPPQPPAGGRIPRRTEAGPAPLSFAQERLWFLQELEPESSAYNIPAALLLAGALDLPALARALAEIVRRHEALRTVFVRQSGRPVQVVRPPGPVPIGLVDLGGLPRAAARTELADAAAAEAAAPFDLAAGGPLRVRLVRLPGDPGDAGAAEHALLLTLHHIAADGWSLGVLVGELGALYGAFRAGRGAEAGGAGPLPELAIQFADYAVWQRGQLAGAALDGLLAWWREALAGAPPVLELPADRPRPAVPSGRGCQVPVALAPALVRGLTEAGRQEGATLFMTLLAGWKALLLRLAGRADLVVGAPAANRGRPETEPLIGFLINTLALRSDLSGNPSWREAVARVRRTVVGAWGHQDLPFERLVEALALQRSLSHAPLVQVLLSLQSGAPPPLALPGLAVSRLEVARASAKLDLSLELEEQADGGLAGWLEVNSDLFDRATAARWAGHLTTLLQAAAADPSRPLAELPLLAEAEAREVLAWSRGADPAPADPAAAAGGLVPAVPALAEAFAARAAAAPAAIALESLDGARPWTYGELEAASNRLARWLLAQGIGPGTRVGLGLDRCPELLLAALAVIKAGGAYVPLDPAQPAARLARMAADGRLALLLTVERLACGSPAGMPELPGVARRLLDGPDRIEVERLSAAPLARSEKGEKGETGETGSRGAGPDDLLYVIFTSGSTGQPKGAGVTRGAFDRLLAWYAGELGLGPDDRVLVISSPSFDLTQKTLFAPLLAGGRLLLGPEPYDPQLLAGAVARHGVTRINCTPSAFHPLLAAAADLGDLASLRSVILGGEPVSPARLAAWRGHPACRAEVVNSYGPTECTDVVAFHRLLPAEQGPVPIGRPLPGLRLLVVDRVDGPATGLLPLGVPGQLAVAGGAVGAGYLGDPALTAGRFLPDPTAFDPGARLYLTGDLARWRPPSLPTGLPVLEYLGRIDQQVKVRGFRVELGEIEAALAAAPGVREAAVAIHADRLIGFAAGEGLDALALREGVRERLPDFMVPALVVVLPELPLTPNGKLDRQALVRLAGERPADGSRPAGAPAGELEARLAALFAEVLGLAEGVQVGRGESFFDLGGHSLLATQLQSRIRDTFGLDLPLRRFFEAPTPAALAGLLGAPPVPPPGPPAATARGLAGERRQALGEMRAARAEAAPAPAGDEARLAEMFAEVLGWQPGSLIGRDESFFDLGGHSLLAAQLQARIRQAFGVDLPLRRLFDAPTPAGLAGLLRAAVRSEGEPAAAGPAEEGEPALSFAQERMWFLDRLDPGSAVYNISLTVRAEGVLVPAALAAAFGAVTARHEPLCSRFPAPAGRPLLALAPPAPPPLPVMDLTALPAARREAAARELGRDELARPFDLAAGPLLRTALVLLAPGEHHLLCTVHHIAADGWSVGLLVRELAAAYGAAVRGEEPWLRTVPPLPARYRDFARWQRGQLAGGVLAAQAGYWRERLADLPVLRLPTDRPRPPHRAQRGSSVEFCWPAEAAAPLAGLARREGATLFMVLLAGLQAVLGRWSGQRDFAVGTPVANRTHTWSEGLIGLFVNTLALRSGLRGLSAAGDDADGAAGGALLARVRQICLDAYDHQDLPFERLIEELAPERDPSFTPLVQVMLTLQNTPLGPLALPGLTLTPVFLPSPGARFDLTLSVEERGGGIVGLVEYDRDLFDGATAERLTGHFAALLGALADEPGRRVDELSLLTGAERAQLVLWERAAEAEARAPLSLSEAFAARVAADPGAVALEAGERRWTYKDLGESVARLAGRLAAAGVGPWTRVGLGLDRCPEFVMAALAVARAGGAYVPLDPAQPAARLGRMAEDAGLALLVTVERLAGRLPEVPGVRRIVLDGADRTEIDRAAPLVSPPGGLGAVTAIGGPDDLLYVIYTSGSTGQPKGAGVTRRGFANLLAWYAGTFGFGPEDRVLALSAVGFDLTQKTLFAPLVTGGRLLLGPEPYDPRVLAGIITGRGVTRVNCTPSAFYPLLEDASDGADPDEGLARLASLRSVFLGGEPIAAARLEAWRRHPACRAEVLNTYGPTECSDVVAWHRLEPDPALSPEEAAANGDRPVPIGRPVPGARLPVLDPALGTQPAGVPGQLAVAGVPVGAGYLGDPALTADRFRPDAGETGARLYLTGDLARRRPDGLLEYLGRIDHQVKVRGFRIELGEIEAALAGCPGVREAAVAVRESAAGARLVAYVVPAGTASVDVAALRAHLAGTLPDFMVPSSYLILDALPLSPNGKVDRRALPAPPDDRDLAAPFVAPRGELEELLCSVFADVLGVSRVGTADSFFDLGGHSLLATRLSSRIYQACGVEVPLRFLFERPTVAALAPLVARGGDAAEASPSLLSPLTPCSGELAELPLSYAQERLWILDRFEPGSAAYNIPAAVRFRGRLDASALAESLAEVVRRHGALRTGFRSLDGRPSQVVEPAVAFGTGIADLAALSPQVRERELAPLAAAFGAAPFDLTRPPLLRAALVCLDGGPKSDPTDGDPTEGDPASGDWVLLLCLHHIAGDGWSLGVLVAELTRLYEAAVRGDLSAPSPGLPPLAIQYADYAVWQRRHLGPAALAGQLAYWRNQLAGLPPALELPTDRPRPAVRSYRGGRGTLHLGDDLAGRLRRVARGASATPFMVLLAAFAALLGRLAGEEDLAVGTPVAGRGRAELEPLIGMFLNTLVLRVDLGQGQEVQRDGGPDFAGLVARVRETALAAYAHQDVPFEMLLDDLQPERDLSRTPLFQVFFNLLNFPLPELRLPDLALESWEAPEMPAKFDLTAYLVPEGDSFAVELVYNRDLFDQVRIDGMLAQYRLLLEQVAEDPRRPLPELSLLTPAAAAVLPDPAAALDRSWVGAVGDLVSARAAAAPERPAVIEAAGGRRVFTYGELEARSNRLAHRLLGLGLARGEVVAVWAHRSAPLTGAVIGILKAGGAFLLLDPAYPAARLAEILELARPAAWLRLAAAGAPPAEVAAYLNEAVPLARRLVLPSWAEADPFAVEPAEPPDIALGPGDLAYLAFTSGSTGVPKGILGLHGPLTHFLPWMAGRYGFGPDDRFSLLSALSHDPLQRDLFTPLCLGGTVCIPDPREIMAAGALAAWMAAERVTVANLTPAMAQVLTEQAAPAHSGQAPATPARSDQNLPDLRLVFLVGDVLTSWIVARLRRLAPAVTCVNHYGSTETQRAVGYHVIPPPGPAGQSPASGAPADARQILPLGRGIPDVQLLVLAPGGEGPRRAGVGEVGEIAVRSPHVAGGYLGDAALTRARFQVNPFTGAPGDRIYLTGDLGRYLPDGQVTFAGRADQQVKVRGFRIELGEIEGRLCRLPGVREAAVLANGEGDARRLVAYVVPEAPGAVAGPALRARIQEQLPAYMVPAAFVLLERLPLTPNGKLDRRALATSEWTRLDFQAPETAMSYKAPETETERTIAAILQEVLEREQVGVEDNFFEVGGNSLLLVQVHSRLQQALGREIQVVDLFNNPTVSSLARHLAGGGTGLAPAATPAEDRSEKLQQGQNRLRRRLAQRQRA